MADEHVQTKRTTKGDVVFVALAVGSTALLLYLGRASSFYGDEWRFITFQGGLRDYLRPYNEHWSTFPLALYRMTFAVVGLRSYLPYLAEVLVLHVLAVSGAYAIARYRIGPWLALLAVAPLLLLGSGAENLFWAFQTGFIGSVAFGVWALFLIERRSRSTPVIVSGLLVLSLMSSGMGLFFLIAVALRTLLDRTLRRRAVVTAPPALAYLAWFAWFGTDPVGTRHGPVADEHAIRFAIRGLSFATDSYFGLNQLFDQYAAGLALVMLVVSIAILQLARKRRPAPVLAVACVIGLGAEYSLIALVRAALVDFDFAVSSRYVYVAAFFLTLAVVDLLPRRGSWPARGTPARMGLIVALSAGLLLALVGNLKALDAQATGVRFRADSLRAYVKVVEANVGTPWIDEGVRWHLVPPPPTLRALVRDHGSPLRDELIPPIFGDPGPAAREVALLAAVGKGFAVRPAGRAGSPVPLARVQGRGVVFGRDGSCLRARVSPDAPLGIRVRGGIRLRMLADSTVDGLAYLGHDFSPSRPLHLKLDRGRPRDLAIPDIGDGRPWQIAIEHVASVRRITICAFDASPDAVGS